MKKSIWFWLCFVLSVILAIYFATRIIMTTMGIGGGARVKSVLVTSVSNTKNLSVVSDVIGIRGGTDTYSVSLSDVNLRVGGLPDIEKSAVRRLPNGNLSVLILPYYAIALWSDDNNLYPVSSNGAIIKRQISERPANTVVFRGFLPADINEITKSIKPIANVLDYATFVENRRWDVWTMNGIRIMLPETDTSAALANVINMDKKHQILSRKITVLDMRDNERILVK